MNENAGMLVEEELAVIRDLRADLDRAHTRNADLRKEVDALRNELTTIRWVARGIAAERAQVTFTVNALMTAEQVQYAMRVFGENAAIELLRQAKLNFKARAREWVMRRYIIYLQNHARTWGLQFSELGEDNDGVRDIFADDWEPRSYLGDEITKRELPRLTIADYKRDDSLPPRKQT